ncbi:MAG: hypothetical protein KatS3mg088_667 [Patescibacteria group bacterium]|nr:MAG: hypothetical protein KatS3mg088_667 [Patescibacteria group bacterium]
MGRKKVVVIGGGTGTYQVLSGLKKYDIDISAIISMCDSGGSTGRLRKELGILPPGDIRRAILALSDLPFAQKTLEELFNFRFKEGASLKGHSVGNILLAALTQITGSMDKAIEEAARILHVSGSVFPVTLDKTNLVAVLSDGTRIYGESNIDEREIKLELPIKKVYLNPKARIYIKAAKEIKNADLILIAPGDLYTSILPTILVDGVTNAISESKGQLAYVVNLMTKRGETDNFTASDFVSVIERYLGSSFSKLKYVLVNKKINGSRKEMVGWYRKFGSLPVVNDLKQNNQFKILERDFISKTTFFRHDPDKLAKAVVSVLE